ncbi:MFS transporter [Streptomyces sp. WI03-4A]|uniref:MFS transporter n=1 Tax=Streptomyces sp. WI03-4A TaxID=3028706 RepID=UPI0029A9CEF0|nr:MFS transporter [Streptomyces sp. WI03-4A]MDX2594227.1 MFS transporter [Streptomyces sp. WI03-4A]
MFTLSVRRRRRVLAAALLSDAVFPLAITGATAAVPEATDGLPGPAALGPWTVLAYNGLFAAALLLAGATADRTARTRFFAAGNLVVAVTGLLSALAPGLPALVALRAVAGVGAAMCAAGGSSMVLAVYPPGERRRVYGYVGAVLGGSLALGPVVAQGLMAVGGWPLVFVVPGAVAALAALATLGLPGLRGEEPAERFDRAGAVLFGLAVAAAVTALGLGFGGAVPWWGPVGLLLVAAACATALVRVERRVPAPAIPLDLLRIPAYRAYAVATGAFMGMLVVGLTVFPPLGSEQGLGPSGAAVVLSLLTVPSTVLPLFAARLARRWARPLVTGALAACAVTAAVLQVTDRPVALFVASGAVGLCLGLTEGVPDGQALAHVPAARGGAGAALFGTARMSLETLTLSAAAGVTTTLGPAAGLAVAGTVCLTAALLLHHSTRPGTPGPASRVPSRPAGETAER